MAVRSGFSLVVSEDVLEEMPVDSWEEGIQLIFFQEGGPITPVKVCTTSSRLEEQSAFQEGRKVSHESVGPEAVCHLFNVLLQSLLLLYDISKRDVRVGRIPVVHERHLTTGLRLAVQ